MKLVTFLHQGRTAIGKIEGRQVVDLQASAPSLPKTLRKGV